MIIVELKPISKIYNLIKDKKEVLILGCGSCASVSLVGGARGVSEVASVLKILNSNLVIKEVQVERQCENEFISKLNIDNTDVIISLGCGVGVQVLALVYPNMEVYPGVDTKFLGKAEAFGIFREYCICCGDCLLDRFCGICPITRCSKGLLNGPCGGSSEETKKCELKDRDCAWILIYDRLKRLNKLDLLEEIIEVRDWSKSWHGGVREVSFE